MSVKRYGLGRQGAHGVGQPTIVEQADGPYVRFVDYEAIAKELLTTRLLLDLADKKAAWQETQRINRSKKGVEIITEFFNERN